MAMDVSVLQERGVKVKVKIKVKVKVKVKLILEEAAKAQRGSSSTQFLNC
jgi:uncharacterized protein (DUF1778 family)